MIEAGKMMEDALSLGMMDSPSARLRRLIDHDKESLDWYRQKNPQVDLSKRYGRLMEYDRICREIEACEPLEVSRTIREKLFEAKKHKFNPNTAVIYLPLTSNPVRQEDARLIVIDFNPLWQFPNPYEYDLLGWNTSNRLRCFISSNNDAEGNRYGG